MNERKKGRSKKKKKAFKSQILSRTWNDVEWGE